MKVVKFGGSSVADAGQLEKVKNIVTAEEERRVVVVSAPGKRYSGDQKVTDLLIKLGESIHNGEVDHDVYKMIIDRFQSMVDELNLPLDVLEEVRKRLEFSMEQVQKKEAKAIDSLKSCGEDGSALILSAYLRQEGYESSYVNPKEAGILVRDEPAAPLCSRKASKSYTS